MPSIKMEFWDRDHSVDADGVLHSATIPYIVTGFTEPKAMLDYAYLQIPKKLENLIDLDSVEISERISEDVWKVIASYPHVDTNPEEASEEIPEFSFDISAETKHITHSIQTIGNYAPPGETAPNYNRAINVNDNGDVEGVDIVKSTFSFTEKHYYSDSKMTNTFKRQIAELVGKVNSGTFRNWQAGELNFIGATGSRRGKTAKDKWEVVFRFKVSMNRTNVQVGNITIPAINGWDYLWVKYENTVAENELTKKIASAHVERVYEYVSFNNLK